MQSAPLRVTVAPADVREDWCTVCKAYTRLVGSLALLTPAGVSTVGSWAWCEICDDPGDREVTRG
ncbi:hypothetical protein [Streptomyces sp. NPDC058891]|uniref:hypothetical protein n=1 Tax=Streptomyces sp. NPDC058891 TaxID=3346667 RepID=UPI00369C51BA